MKRSRSPGCGCQEGTPLAICTPHELLRTDAISLLADCVNMFGLVQHRTNLNKIIGLFNNPMDSNWTPQLGLIKAGTAGCPGWSIRAPCAGTPMVMNSVRRTQV